MKAPTAVAALFGGGEEWSEAEAPFEVPSAEDIPARDNKPLFLFSEAVEVAPPLGMFGD